VVSPEFTPLRDILDRVGRSVIRGRPASVYYLDIRLRSEGSTLKIGNREYPIQEASYVVFADDEPGANWGHPCRYLLIPSRRGGTYTIDETMPPSLTTVPATYRLIWSPPAVPDWALWTSNRLALPDYRAPSANSQPEGDGDERGPEEGS
jgi:hypothetical protein